MKISMVLAVVAAIVALAVAPAWSQHDRSQPFEASNAGNFMQEGKTLSLTEQLTELEMIVFTKNFEDDTLLNRMSRLTDKLLASQKQSIADLPLEGQIGHLWQAIEASPKYKTACVQPPQQQSNNSSSQLAQPRLNTAYAQAPHTPFPPPTAQPPQRPFNTASDQTPQLQFNTAYAQAPQQQFNIASAQPPQLPFATNNGAAPNNFYQQSMPSGQSQFSQFQMGGSTEPVRSQAPISDINLNRRVMAFAAQHFGKQVGNGECWTLAAQALEAAGALPAEGYTFGRELTGNEEWWPGDIIQFTKCKFKENFPGGRHTIIEAGSPNHTAIYGGQQNGMSMIAQSNYNGKKTVAVMYIDLKSLVSGKYQVFRPVMLQ